MTDIRYIPTPLVKTDGGLLIPLWKCSDIIISDNSIISLVLPDGSCNNRPKIIEGMFDLKKHKIELFDTVEYRPKPKYQVGQIVAIETTKPRRVRLRTIKAIIDGRIEEEVMRGTLVREYIQSMPDLIDAGSIDGKAKYTFKTINSAYVMNDGSLVEWEHEIFMVEK